MGNILGSPSLHITPTYYHEIHGFMMYTTWGVLTFIQFISGRYLSYYFKARQILHSIVGLCMLILGWTAFEFASHSRNAPLD